MGSGAIDRGAIAQRIEVPDVEGVLADAWDQGCTILDPPDLDERGRLVARYSDPRGRVIVVVQESTTQKARLVQ